MSQKEKKWFPVITRKGQPVLFNSYVLTGFQDQYYREVLLLRRGIHCLKYVEGFVVLEENDSGTLANILAEHITPEYLSFFIAKCRKESDLLLHTASDIRSNSPYNSMNNSELNVLFTTYSSAVFRVMTFLTTIVILENVLQNHLEKILTDHCKKHDVKVDHKAYLTSLIFPQKESIPSQALIELYKLGNQVNSNTYLRKLFELSSTEALKQAGEKFPKFREAFDKYLKKFDFMNMEYYAGQPLLPEELFERIKSVTKDAEGRLSHIKQEQKNKEKEFNQASKKLKLTPELISLINSAGTIHYLRQHRADALFKAGRDVLDLFKTIAQRLDINYDQLVYLAHDEISTSILKGKLIVDKQTIKARQDRYAILWIDLERSIVTGDAVERELAMLTTEKVKVKELQGNVAFRGAYRGRVAIVTNHNEIYKVQPGDVLVSPMTDPYFVPAMVKAGAIVTDEGGILSHAAIVSRELGIPCIVGTGVATSTLKDGMIVDVDAMGEVGRVNIVKE
jgi:phosphoenolpyruvate synthase/pyruvate phosphate dikinase